MLRSRPRSSSVFVTVTFVTVTFVAVGLVVQGASAQPPRNPAPSRPASAAARPPAGGKSTMPPSKYWMVPGLAPLSMESVQREIGLSAEQKQQLKALSDGYQAAVQKAVAPLRELPPEEQQKQSVELREQIGQMARGTQRKGEAILTPQQLRTIQTISFEMAVGQMLANPAAQEKLGLDAEQRQKLMSVYERAGEKMQKLQRETAGQLLDGLSEEQIAKLRQQVELQQKQQ